MTTHFKATNAASSGIYLDRKQLKALFQRSDRPGGLYLLQWVLTLIGTGSLVGLAADTLWVWPAMLLYGTFLCVPAYALSHETAHGTAFRSRGLNEVVFWLTSLIYFEEPLFRRYTHTNHHTYTWHTGKDSQMPFDTPMNLPGWLLEVSGFALWRFHLATFWQLATKRYSDILVQVAPGNELPRMSRNARFFILIYMAITGLVMAGHQWPLLFLVGPRILGAPVMLLFTLIQHVEMQENSPSIVDSTRSFQTNGLGRFLYLNMNHHIEHHLYPQVPFYALPGLHNALADQLPPPDRGFFKTNFEVLSVVFRRSRGKNTQARGIRQAPHMVTEGRYDRIGQATM